MSLAYGALLLVLALYKGREFWKLNGVNGSRLVFVLVRDQAIYYAMYDLFKWKSEKLTSSS